MPDLTEGEFGILRRAQALAVKHGASQVDVVHFAAAFLDARPHVVEHWRSHGVDADGVRASLESALRSQVWLPPGSERFATPAAGPLVMSTEVAALIRQWREISPQADASRIATSDLARNLLLCVPATTTGEPLSRMPSSQQQNVKLPTDATVTSMQVAGTDDLPPGLAEHGRDLTRLAAIGGLDPLIGRHEEVDRIVRVLSRKKKRNPVLVGKAGVGKTVIVEGLALRIAAGDVPKPLLDSRLIALSLASLLGGTRYRGEFEARLHAIIEEATTGTRRTLLFFDEFHLIVKAGAAEGGLDMGSLLLSAMARGDISVIGATTPDEFKENFNHRGPLERRVQVVEIAEPTDAETIDILRGLRSTYESFHAVQIDEAALVAVVQMTRRGRALRGCMPDVALDLLDDACALAHARSAATLPPNVPIRVRSDDVAIVLEERRSATPWRGARYPLWRPRKR